MWSSENPKLLCEMYYVFIMVLSFVEEIYFLKRNRMRNGIKMLCFVTVAISVYYSLQSYDIKPSIFDFKAKIPPRLAYSL